MCLKVLNENENIVLIFFQNKIYKNRRIYFFC